MDVGVTRFISSLRALAFYAGYIVVTVVWGSLSVLVAWLLPMRARFLFVIGCWTRLVLGWLRVCCGITCRIEGMEHVPSSPCIVLVRHESTWETLFIQTLFAPQATLVKRELLYIPFFGWAFRLLRPIAIDRKDPRSALRSLIREGRARLSANFWVVLFPEGTRMPVGEMGSFQLGGAALAEATGTPVIVVAHDAGRYWPAHRFGKTPGVIRVQISPPIRTEGRKTREINTLAREWMIEALSRGGDGATGGRHEAPTDDQTSRLTTASALDSMNWRRGST
jgi:1-acyl-sn-glycerol-3-phosphate acyltransferase